MKLLHLAHNCVLASNQERLVELARLGDYDITLLVPPDNLESHGVIRLEKDRDPNYRILRGRPMLSMVFGRRYLQFYPEIGSVLRRARPDILDVHEEPWSLTAYHALLQRNKKTPRAPVVVETEQNVYKEFPPPFGFFERAVLRHADAVIARNIEAEEVVRRKGFRGITRILPNGLDTNIFRRQDASARRRELGLQNIVVGYAGRLEREKGLDDLLRAVARLDMPLDVLFVGQGGAEAELRGLAGSAPPRGRFVCIPPVAQKQLPLHLNCMDTLVLPSRTTPTWKEQFGRVLIEAMACETPVVGSSSGAIPEVIGEAGMVFQEGDVPGLAAAIEKMLTDTSARDACVQNGLRKVRDEFAWAAVAGRLDALYRELVT